MTRINMKMATVFLMGAIAAGSTQANVELAKIGAKSLTDGDVKGLMGSIPEGQKQQINGDPDIKKRMVDNLIVEELFIIEAEKSGVTKDKEYLQTLERAKRQILAQRFLQKNVQPKLTDANVKAFFEKSKERYNSDEVEASHVLVKSEAEASEVLTKAKAGEDFEVLAKKYSKDPSAQQNGGKLGFFTRSRMVPEFANKAFSMKKGEISDPVKTVFGFHIIKVTDSKKGTPVKFDEIKEQVRSDFQNQTIQELVESLKKSNKVVVHEDKIKSLKF